MSEAKAQAFFLSMKVLNTLGGRHFSRRVPIQRHYTVKAFPYQDHDQTTREMGSKLQISFVCDKLHALPRQ
jgi:hypothetical protein